MIEVRVPHKVEERDLVRDVLNGDKQAFEIIYKQNAPRVYALCLRMTANEDYARDLVQIIFIKIWKKLAGFKGHSQLSTWIHTIAIREIIDFLKKTKAGLELSEQIPVSYMMRVDLALDMESALQLVPTGARTILVLHDVEGFTHKEIARLLNISAGTSKAQLHRAREILKELLK